MTFSNRFFAMCAVCALLVWCGSVVFGQALEPIGGPYTVDNNTVVLLHFDGTYTNAAAAVGLTDTIAVRHATNLSKISFMTGTTGMGQCVRINNSAITDSAYLTIKDTAALDMTGNWTIEAWANIFTFGSTSSDYRWVPRVVMKPGDNIFYEPNYWLEMWGDNRLFHAGYFTGSEWISVTSPNNMFQPGQWVHLTFIRDTLRQFIACMVHDANKNLLGFLSRGFDKNTQVPLVNRQDMHMGWAGAGSGDSWLDGWIDEVRISKVVRNFGGPPVIKSTTVLPNQPSGSTPYSITVEVIPLNAGGSISNAVLKYRTDTTASTVFTSVTMTSSGTDKFSGSIPGQTVVGKIIQYYVQVTDNNGYKSRAPVDSTTYYTFGIYPPNAKLLDLTFEEGPTGTPVDHSGQNTKVTRSKILDYSTQVPTGGGTYSLLLQSHAGISIDSNWVEADSPFLAVEEFTLDCWVKADSAELHATRIIINPSAATDWNNANFELSFRNGSAGKPVFTARYWKNDGSGAVVLQDTNVATTKHVGKWRHVIVERKKADSGFAMVVNDENNVRMYKQVAKQVLPPLMAGAPLRIGRSHFDTNDNWYVSPYRGKIDNVQVFNYAARGITSVESEATAATPMKYALDQNYPNPFNPSTEIQFVVPKFGHVTLEVFDLLGRKVRTLVNDERHAGSHRVTWNAKTEYGTPVASGMYIYRLTTSDVSLSKKMMLVR
jgi:hypothetical protein